MPTLGALKADIAADLVRDDLTTQIASAITNAIRFHRPQPYWWMESRDTLFTTVADQQAYSLADAADIARIVDIKHVIVTRDNSKFDVTRVDQSVIEYRNDNNLTGIPDAYSFFDGMLYFSPIPDDAYAVQVIGNFTEPAPASDAEAGNLWMTEAYNLLRSEAKRELATHVVRDLELKNDMEREARREKSMLIAETNRRKGSNTIHSSELVERPDYDGYHRRLPRSRPIGSGYGRW